MAYEYQPYPRMMFGSDGTYAIVQNYAEEQAALASGWHSAPVPAPDPAVGTSPAVVEESAPLAVKRGPGRPRKVAL